MGRPHISLRGQMALVVAVGLGLAALRAAVERWAGVVLLATLGLLTAAILGVAYRSGGRRAGWLGFALFGWGYAALALGPWSEPRTLPTGVLLDLLYARVSPSKVVAMDPLAASGGPDAGDFLVPDPDPPTQSLPAESRASDAVFAVGTLDVRSFRTIGHCLFALLAGLTGALVARRFHATGCPSAPAIPRRGPDAREHSPGGMGSA